MNPSQKNAVKRNLRDAFEDVEGDLLREAERINEALETTKKDLPSANTVTSLNDLDIPDEPSTRAVGSKRRDLLRDKRDTVIGDFNKKFVTIGREEIQDANTLPQLDRVDRRTAEPDVLTSSSKGQLTKEIRRQDLRIEGRRFTGPQLISRNIETADELEEDFFLDSGTAQRVINLRLRTLEAEARQSGETS